MAATDIQTGGIATFSILANGSPIPATYRVLSVNIEKAVNRIASARIVILDGDAASGEFEASSSSVFIPGNTISIAAGYGSFSQTVFEGIITAQQLRVDNQIGSTLEVVCHDKAVKMTVGRRCRSFAGQTDSEAINSIARSYGFAAEVAATMVTQPQLVQYDATDWDFVLSRAEANGLVVATVNNKLSVFAPDANITPVLSVGYGMGLLEFHAKLDALTQLAAVTASAWDPQTQGLITTSAQMSEAGAGNLSSKTLSQVIGLEEYTLQTACAATPAELDQWSKAQLVKSGYSKIRGEATFQGSALAEPGRYITLQRLGDRFNGDHFIGTVTHDLADGNWTTRVSLGLSPTWFTELPDIMAPPAAGLLPGIGGLLHGTVKQVANDPDGQYRILVNIPLFDRNAQEAWARLAGFYSGSSAGTFVLPKPGDAVVVGFLNEDPRYPVILGNLYSSPAHPPPLQPADQNPLKAIVTRSGISFSFDDAQKTMTLSTPAHNTITLDDQGQQISIADQYGNSILLSAGGITLNSPQNISIQAGQSVSISGTHGISLQSTGGDVTVEGTNIQQTANSSYSATGATAANISATGNLTLKGAMIMIN